MRTVTDREIELGVKTCKKCGVEKKLEEFFNHKLNDKSKYHRGRNTQCKDCKYPDRENRGEPYYLCGDTAFIPLHNNKREVLGFCKVDKEDIEKVMLVSKVWCLDGAGYVRTNGDKKMILIHRVILNLTDPKVFVDHISHQTLDNRKSNLRQCTSQQNLMNQKSRKNSSSQYKGVSWNKKNKKWTAHIMINKKIKHLGCFKDEDEAAKAYNKAAKENFGEFAYLNKINEKK